jgi:4-hydroxy-4-methyl-2-oxoglutarate aldolase
VSDDDIVFGDNDGVLLVAAEHAEQVPTMTHQIWQTEREQARRIRADETLHQQTASTTTWRGADPSYTFRQRIDEAIKE